MLMLSLSSIVAEVAEAEAAAEAEGISSSNVGED